MAKSIKTEEKILESASEVFREKGFNGARMREIADTAGINKGLLHYYFKTKDALFEAVFKMAFRQVISRIHRILETDASLDDKIDQIVDTHLGMILKNPSLPNFVISELNKDADRFIQRNISQKEKFIFAKFMALVEREAEAGRIKKIDARQLLMNIISMIIFPVLGRPVMQVIFGTDNEEFGKLLLDRKQHIKQFVKDALKP
ncbi:TetR/AcrR family transcriptional regulator [Fulvivirga kasyanovii]|uniref:TetR/AcrR family transcriptional regulator n=1 Tax=Fulvivirga kasyanovii TaxID=396812 RepID=A0ABW9RK54_9BACT|nr:TetR/AcrR family transcriptional regulator [Fulvivirga kasyanovii]MTI24459.1 TetR/AcrR family transcriptional regulator [Fulvivirga kasyanovii]